MNVLNANHITKRYKYPGGAIEVLQNVNLQIAKGEMVAIMGPSGSGKTTLLNILSGIDTPDDGSVEIRERDLVQLDQEEIAAFRRKYMGMIFQDFQLLESLSVEENILLPLILDKKEDDEQREALEKVMGTLGITELASKGITDISGGQKQRVAIGRALINEPEIIFGDEPTGSLDIKTTRDVMQCMVQMNRQFDISFLIVTHDVYAASFCHRVLLLQDGKMTEEVHNSGNRSEFKEELMKMLGSLGGGQDDLL